MSKLLCEGGLSSTRHKPPLKVSSPAGDQPERRERRHKTVNVFADPTGRTATGATHMYFSFLSLKNIFLWPISGLVDFIY